ncbi:MAG: DUF397 domain-containing protein [Sporichthyaceae bacterium]|nr:DUF397 domain-containing protein [Sporichthyaceae bacterium]
MAWRKSSMCMVPNETCVEIDQHGDDVLVRNSKDPAGPVLRFTLDEWAAFTDGVKAGEFESAVAARHL